MSPAEQAQSLPALTDEQVARVAALLNSIRSEQ